MTPRYILIANPGTKRCEAYRRALNSYWSSRAIVPIVEVVPWAEIAPRDGNLDGLTACDRPAIVRLESPGKIAEVTRLLLEAGARESPSVSPCDWRSVDMPKGVLMRPGLWFRGFRRVLQGLRQSFDARPQLRPTACPLAVADMFDKTRTAIRLREAGVPVPEMLNGPVDMPEVVHDLTIRFGWPCAYIKLNSGSSATGIVVLTPNNQARPASAVTSLAEINGVFHNSRRLREVRGPELNRAVQFILDEGAIVQRGIPMAQIDGLNFDVRVVCVYGKPVATIFRLSSNPMTNLHLGGSRGEFAACRARIPTRQWLDAIDHCADAAACFDSAVAGVDLVFELDFREHYVLEVNAFGDFFPGWTNEQGQSIHELEIEATQAADRGPEPTIGENCSATRLRSPESA